MLRHLQRSLADSLSIKQGSGAVELVGFKRQLYFLGLFEHCRSASAAALSAASLEALFPRGSRRSLGYRDFRKRSALLLFKVLVNVYLRITCKNHLEALLEESGDHALYRGINTHFHQDIPAAGVQRYLAGLAVVAYFRSV